ncbi:MAG TPA: VOC family protein [Terriglobales bacterium]
MLKNRSVPTDILLPHIVYRDVASAIAWLTAAFGFVEHYRCGDPVDGAQMHLGDAWILLASARPGRASPVNAGHCTQSLTIFVDDVDAHYRRAKAAGARIVEELNETGYGELQYGVEDLDGHHWLFSRHARDVSPADWGAKIAER